LWIIGATRIQFDRDVLDSLITADSYIEKLVMASSEEIKEEGWGQWDILKGLIVVKIHTEFSQGIWITTSRVTIKEHSQVTYVICDENGHWDELGLEITEEGTVLFKKMYGYRLPMENVPLEDTKYPYGMGTAFVEVVCPEPYGYVEPTVGNIQLLCENGSWITIWEGLKSIRLFGEEPEKFFAEVEVPEGTYIGTRIGMPRLATQVKWTEKRVTLEEGIVTKEEVLDSWITEYSRDFEQYVIGEWPGTWVYRGGKATIVYDVSIVDLGEFEDPITFMKTLENPSWGMVNRVWTLKLNAEIK
jgi:hypothetical protein